MSKSNDLMINIIRDAITGGNVITGELESSEIHAGLVKEIEKILFTKKALSKALNNCKKDLTSLGKELGVSTKGISEWFESQAFENGGGFFAERILDLTQFGPKEINIFIERMSDGSELIGSQDLFVKIIKRWHKTGGHKKFLDELLLRMPRIMKNGG